jgi:hypothetical protein
MGETVNTRVKFWLLLLLGILVFMPFFFLSLFIQVATVGFSFFGLLNAAPFLGGFMLYCYLLYRFVHKAGRPRYPIVPPEGRTDIYFPRTDIPRPVHEDVRRYPQAFGKKTRWKKRAERLERMRKKK